MSPLVLILLFIHSVLSVEPPKYGPWGKGCCTHKSVHVGGYVAGGSQDAIIAYPTQAIANKTTLPFLAFAHGMGTGGAATYSDYNILWDIICSYGYIIVAPQSCREKWCQNFYEDVTTTIITCKSKKSEIDPALEYADFSKIGVYGHSMGGGATVEVSDNKNLDLVASVGLHPDVARMDNKTISSEIALPMLWFTGSNDTIVPPSGVWQAFTDDPIRPKIYAEIKGGTHFDPTSSGRNDEDAYVAMFFDCWIKDINSACDYFYSTGNKNICTGGPSMTKCQLVGNKTSIIIQ
eukprot:41179_1